MIKNSVNITFVIASLQGGGAERVLWSMAKFWNERGKNITVITMDSQKEDAYPLPMSINRISLDLSAHSNTLFSGIVNNVKRVSALKHAIISSSPDVIISFLTVTNIITLLATRTLRMPIIVTEHNAPNSADPRHNRGLDKVWSLLRRFTYRRVAKLVSVSHGVDRCFSWLPAEQRHVIYNPIVTPELVAKASELSKHPWLSTPDVPVIMAMGRLAHDKGFDLLLKAFKKLLSHTDARLIIGGKGPLDAEVKIWVEDLKLQNHVNLPGFIENPFAILSKVDFFVLSSRSEGFGNVLVEAMACGCPVISFDCPYGPKEIIIDSGAGILVPPEDVDALADAMLDVLHHPDKQKQMAAKATNITERFTVEKVMDQWDKLVCNALKT
jgi:glycosyltransferase involved in cell wall biosynthesis